jgi:hypothetical protein
VEEVMGPIRRRISLTLALGLLGGGCYILFVDVKSAMTGGGFSGRLLVMAVFMVVIGIFWIVEDDDLRKTKGR